jgi:tetratricopeptide (TPR) repeat protein
LQPCAEALTLKAATGEQGRNVGMALGTRWIGRLVGALIAAASVVAPGHAAGLAGPYLAGMQADFRNDYAAAADYFARALARDPGNVALMQNVVVARVAAGDLDGAVEAAPPLLEAMPENQVAALLLMADALRNGNFEAAAQHAENRALNLNPLLAGLVSGWIEVGLENFTEAQARFDALRGNEAVEAYGLYHKALALALAGDFVSAEAILAGDEEGPLHPDRDALLAHAEILAQLSREEDAVALIDEALDRGFPDTALVDLRERLVAGEAVPFTQITAPADGAAEAFFTLATALNTEDSDRFALIYARLAHHIRPDLTKASLLAAEVLEAHGQFELATAALADVAADSPWYVTSELRRAATQTAAGDSAAGIATLQALAAAEPELVEVHSALGDALRVEERYVEAAEAYSTAIALLGDPQPVHWVLYYTRAIAYERAGMWPEAEADFREALALEPDQPLVLNYLGYSLVEQRRNLDEALDMIERAVAGQPDDGYITDSLGWVLYRLGRYEEALPHMLRAVELLPADAVINDHLGDVLWKVGRHREAEFQWRRALSLGPADDLDMDRVRRKLDVGLDEVLAGETAGATGQDG